MRSLSFLIPFLVCSVAWCQQDSTRLLPSVTVEAYASERILLELPASVSTIQCQDFQRFSNTNFLPAVNTIPGVRMEERSPGSYRFSIRGSVLRSPFGVRNVKMYWNGLPLTDAGGNTYINLIDFDAVEKMEVIKGPGGSLYGAGTGGVVLLNSALPSGDKLEFSSVIGSYGLRRYQLRGQVSKERFGMSLSFAQQTYDGYRAQSAMTRHSLNSEMTFLVNTSTVVRASIFYTDLHYQTPGGLTLSQYEADPRQARPAAGPNRSAQEQRAAVNNKTPFVGAAIDHDWNESWTSKLGVVANHSDFRNPAIRNVERRSETNVGIRNENQFRFKHTRWSGTWTFGVEAQRLVSPITISNNEFGIEGAVQSKDKLTSAIASTFTQLDLSLPANFFLTVATSVNFNQVRFERTEPMVVNETKSFDPFIAPRIALLNKITPGMSVFASFSRGFSPPTLAELYPSRAIFDAALQEERGNNIEIGLRTQHKRQRVTMDVTAYQFALYNALVIRRLPDNAEYFINSGGTSQRGVEAMITWTPLENVNAFLSGLRIQNSFTLQDYEFTNYVQGDVDFSGNMLTGVSPVMNTTVLDLVFRKFVYVNLTGNYSDHTPLNDANTSFANPYYLLNVRLGYRAPLIKSHEIDIFAGSENLLDQRFSLGNDLNAFGDRFYNVAVPRTYFVGVRFRLNNE